MEFVLPSYVSHILNTLHNTGYEAFLVGGCVRDHLMGRCPHDYDITTNALPEQTAALFDKTVNTGMHHGTVTVVCDDGSAQVTTYRTESGYTDHRQPDSVTFVSSLKDDLQRRDFTVNAMAYTPETGLVDPFGGRYDLHRCVLRTVGDPFLRFREDALRILRLYRFACRFGFAVDPCTEAAALAVASTLRYVSAERIAAELEEIWCSDHPERLLPLLETEALADWGFHKPETDIPPFVFPKDRGVCFMAFCRWCRGDAVNCAARLKRDNALSKLARQVKHLESNPLSTPVHIKQGLYETDATAVSTALQLRRQSVDLLRPVLTAKEPWRIEDLAVNGTDLKDAGLTGSAIGQTLKELLAYVWEHPDENRKEILLARLK